MLTREEVIEAFDNIGNDSVSAMRVVALLLVDLNERIDQLDGNVIDVENLLDRRTR